MVKTIKKMFTRAIVRRPCKNMVNGITSVSLGKPKYKKALHQHDAYIESLLKCGLEITIMDADENYPDSVFIEDAAVLTPSFALVTNPGADSRKGEVMAVKEVLKDFYQNIHSLNDDETLDGGDVMMVGDTFYVGMSGRTNQRGADCFGSLLSKYGMKMTKVEMGNMLHLKTGLSYLEDNNLVTAGDFIGEELFNQFNKLVVDAEESYAANCIWINDHVLVPEGYPIILNQIQKLGYKTISLDMSEFRKLDGGLSCLSLRF